MIDYTKGYKVWWYDIRTALCFGIIITIIITTLIIIMDTIVCLLLVPVRLESSEDHQPRHSAVDPQPQLCL